MKLRQLFECTIDTAQPLPELSAVISAVISAIPDVDQRADILRKLDDEIVTALIALEEEAVDDDGNGRT